MYCIDAGSNYCPCHLAETLDCVACSQLCGEKFCQCKNWHGICIYEQYISNGNKAQNLRETYTSYILKKEVFQDDLCIFTLKAPENLVKELTSPGSFVFMRSEESISYYDVPISIMEANTDEIFLKVAIKLIGIKTKKLFELNKNQKILLRGPFSNGIMGLSNIYNAKGGTSLIIARGIGISPSIPVMKKLYYNNNKIISILDTQFQDDFSKEYFKNYSSEMTHCTILDEGNLTKEFKSILKEVMDAQNVNIIHCGGSDILTYKIIDSVDDSINFSCCNNAKMNCGEGICASCANSHGNNEIKRLCKLQMDPRDLFKNRKFI
ncbi:sulfide/dihydroorotate dehydrogenase-like FAD/NAD-binding protein [Clostridium sp. WILCCON 0269]|uniref:Sulfide/dihydroorotate dehydrogenase-like FAD/NAD-binding protein n=1 Tax=Candidatus Clostridium eludens TaxID=3381663 RepID=A0ABW8SJ70_9CLOT